ncbi:VIT1/CCC1 family predicted Fe2+/Mn2+ transporter [Hypnocyclicus thermotrophus]|uniref:VIT1/CCC1 family predicted Fe2+/Mn2+ transporter n=1 Tax=Hypnocyclicus thermotrophus TaxID=1627895 RepID=A0AA46DXW5_9FUSO|nr:VIT1/CCC1 transporter family protein [Hypnocyclicus thermotrophus]TDT69126.1 VIT1/CCC1 family predicted Fe2+/Mn2+ transporter [Hypnocyclicus thermotrophus]
MTIDKNIIRKFMQEEYEGYLVYKKLAKLEKNLENSKILDNIGEEELKHLETWKTLLNEKPKIRIFKVWFYIFIARFLGLTFGIKLMEINEDKGKNAYLEILKNNLDKDLATNIQKMIDDEDKHEKLLINMINEEKLDYIGSIVLGLNDALVELTGTLAGLTFALKNTKLIAMSGLITGIAASFSMAASEYLATKAEGDDDALKSSIYTGIAYIFTVIILALPYLVLKSYSSALILTLIFALLIILVFNFYISIAKDYNFIHRFLEMALLSMGVAGLSFIIGIIVKNLLGVEI